MPNTSVEYSSFEAHKNFKLHGKNCRHKNTHSLTETISVDGRNIRNGVIYKNNVSQSLRVCFDKTTTDKAMKKYLVKQVNTIKVCQIIHDKQTDKFHLSVPMEVTHQTRPNKLSLVSVDPGVTPFMSFYSDQIYGFIGENWCNRATKLQKTSDELLKKAQNARHHRKTKLRRAAARCRKKCTNIVNDMQNKVALFFASTYKYILLPKINTKNMVSTKKDKKRSIPSCVARAIMTSSQYQFREKLIRKAHQHQSTVILCKEHYTSKTCTNCGNIKQDLGANKTYNCLICGCSVHRDYNGARNILIRNLSLRDGSSGRNTGAVDELGSDLRSFPKNDL